MRGEFDALFERNRVVSIRGVAIEDETECACPENVFGQYVYRRDFSPREACPDEYSGAQHLLGSPSGGSCPTWEKRTPTGRWLRPSGPNQRLAPILQCLV